MKDHFKKFAVLAIVAATLALATPGKSEALGCRGRAEANASSGRAGLFNGPFVKFFRAVFAPIVQRVQARQEARAEARAARFAVEYHGDGTFTETAGAFLPVPGSVPKVMEGPGVTSAVVPPGSHAHRDAQGNIVIHGSENWGKPGAHSGLNTKRVAEGGQTVTGNVAFSSPVASGKPKRVIIGNKYYDRYPDGSLVECVACNQGR